ncbi:MAG: AAA family ATPase [Planctomycetaceae bacterium]|nr:AAA family ATPase [Planctomycetaceae bacterium]
MKRGLKTALIWCLLLGLVFYALLNYKQNEVARLDHVISQEEAANLIAEGDIVAFQTRGDLLTLKTYAEEVLAVHPLDANPVVLGQLAEHRIPHVDTSPQSTNKSETLQWLVLLVVFFVIFFIILRRLKGGGAYHNLFQLRNSRARPVRDVDQAKFADIGGNREAVAMLEDLVDYIRNPRNWQALKARLPRGILLVGPPGTGKTLLARAVAGETNGTFFYTSASEFVEMFVGIGAARVRDTFEKAAAQQPAVIFIDELDAIGRRRGSGTGTMHEEREQTLNQLLVLLDGLEHHDQLVVMAATNRPDILDPALLRAGRFDRMLRLHPPSFEERIEILGIHTKDKPLADSISLERLARITEGFSGADLESLANDAALSAIRRNRGLEGHSSPVLLQAEDFESAMQIQTRGNRLFDQLDSVLVESTSQFAEPTGRAVAQITFPSGKVVVGDVLWMNATHIKLRLTDGTETVIAKEQAEQLKAMDGTDFVAATDFVPDPWSGRTPDAG